MATIVLSGTAWHTTDCVHVGSLSKELRLDLLCIQEVCFQQLQAEMWMKGLQERRPILELWNTSVQGKTRQVISTS